VLCRRGIIRNPSSVDDHIKDTVLILGIIVTSIKENFYVKRVENRSAYTITRALEGKTCVGSILASDGWASYPAVADNLSLAHIVVNHSVGFINEDGTHINNIEALWSCMKSEMGKQHGVKREDIDMWLEKIMFGRKYIDVSSPESKKVLFDIIKYLVNYSCFCF
ncbi:hypothetical protein NGRA_2377, partial [Nosema granulosis]